MRIELCDVCKKKIKDGKKIGITRGWRFAEFVVCEKCGEPVSKFLLIKRLIKKENEARGCEPL